MPKTSEVMPVFISHRTADDNVAQRIAQRLVRVHNILCYVDDFDPFTKKPGGITELVLDRIGRCTHLLALITDNTIGSWWVPFEIGVARQSDRRIASYDSSTKSLPEYLQEWPIVSGEGAIDKFAELYRQDASAKSLLTSQWRPANSPDQFHRGLKLALGQI